MERVRFEYDVRTILRLSREEVEHLTVYCETHYDIAVKAISKPGEGAILNGARFMLLDKKAKHVDMKVSTHQLNVLCKATEGWLPGDGLKVGLHLKLRNLLLEARDEQEQKNPSVEETP